MSEIVDFSTISIFAMNAIQKINKINNKKYTKSCTVGLLNNTVQVVVQQNWNIWNGLC